MCTERSLEPQRRARLTVRREWAIAVVIGSVIPLVSAQAQQPPRAEAPATRQAGTAVADAAYSAGEAQRAESAYVAVLQADPANSRALYMLAQLRRERPRDAVTLLERYVRLQPRDAWGLIALGDALGRAGRVGDADSAFARAERLAPDERDVFVGRARMLASAGQTDRSIAAYERWMNRHATDAEAGRELARQYRRAGRERAAIASLERAQQAKPDDRTARQIVSIRAMISPRVETDAGGNKDSDDNSVWHLGGVAGFSPADAVDLTVGGGARGVRDATAWMTLGDARVGMSWRPRATTRIEAAATLGFAPGDTGSTTSPQPGRGRGMRGSFGSTRTDIGGRLRYVWQDPSSRARIDLRATRQLLDASPILVDNDVVRNEVGGELGVRVVGPIGLRAAARTASIASAVDDNSRALLAARLVMSLPTGGEITAGVTQVSYDHASTAGYFAPRSARTAEIGAYQEIESERGVTAAFDLGAGAQQITEFGLPASAWAPALRGWGALGVPLAPGRQLRFEVEAYDAKVGNEVAIAASRWRYASASIGLRWSLR